MVSNFELNNQSMRSLRLRLGWSRSDMARRLKCSLTDVEAWEEGSATSLSSSVKGELEIIFRQAEACSNEVKNTTAAECKLDQGTIEQIEFSRAIKVSGADLE